MRDPGVGEVGVRVAVYDHCESMFVTSAMLRLQELRERAVAAEEIESAAHRCQDTGQCPLTNTCLHRFPRPVGSIARRGGDNVVYLRPGADVRPHHGPVVEPPDDDPIYETGLVDDDGNLIIRRKLSLGNVPLRESELRLLLDHWNSLASAIVPRLTDFNPLLVRDFGLLGRFNVVNVAAADARDFIVEIHASGRVFDEDMSGLILAAYAVPIIGEVLMADYYRAKITAAPSYHQVIMRAGGSRLAYARLILPFSDDGQNVNRLLVGFRALPVPAEL